MIVEQYFSFFVLTQIFQGFALKCKTNLRQIFRQWINTLFYKSRLKSNVKILAVGFYGERHLGVHTCGVSPDLDSLKTETTCRKKLESCSVLLELGFLGVMSSCTHRGPMALSNNNTVLQALYTHHQQHHIQVTQPLGHSTCTVSRTEVSTITCNYTCFNFDMLGCNGGGDSLVSGVICIYLVERNSMSLFVFSSFSLGASSRSSRSSGVTKGKFPTLPAVLPPPRLVDEELEVELRPESTTGDACHSRKKSGAPEKNNEGITQCFTH